MAVITFDVEKNSVCVLVEKSDLIHVENDNVIEVSPGSKHTIGKVWINGEFNTLILRGER